MNIVHRILAGLYLVVLFAALSAAQTPFDAKEVSAINVDDSMQGWKPVCILPSCNPGGSGTPTATSHTIGHATPSEDGHSMEVSITGPQHSNALWTYKGFMQVTATGTGTNGKATGWGDVTVSQQAGGSVTSVAAAQHGNVTASFDTTIQQGYVVSVTPSASGVSAQLIQYVMMALD